MDDVIEVTLEEAFDHHRRALVAYAYACAKDIQLAQEIVEEAQRLAIAHADEREEDAELADWLVAIVLHVWESHCESAGIVCKDRPLLHDTAAILFLPEAYSESQKPAQETFATALSNLPAGDGQLLRLCLHEKRSYAEIAIACGLTEPKVKMRVSRALNALRKAMQSQAAGSA